MSSAGLLLVLLLLPEGGDDTGAGVLPLSVLEPPAALVGAGAGVGALALLLGVAVALPPLLGLLLLSVLVPVPGICGMFDGKLLGIADGN